jgi:4a-hydroxytetrahydrobiopterin dehydratase
VAAHTWPEMPRRGLLVGRPRPQLAERDQVGRGDVPQVPVGDRQAGVPEAVPLTGAEIDEQLAALEGWTREDDAITRTFQHAYHECLHFAMYFGAKAREVSHHPDIYITWQRIRFAITTHDAGGKITERDCMLAARIDAIAVGAGAKPVPADR